MTDFSLSGAFGAGPGSSASEPGSQYTLGLSWDTTPGAALWLKGYEFWRADVAVDGPITVETWDQAGVALAGSVATFALSGVGSYQQVLLPTPVPIVVEQAYRTGAHFPDGAYAFVPNYWSSGAGSGGHIAGRLVAPSQADAPDGEQGVLNVGAVRAFPGTGSANAANYFVTPILTDVDPASQTPSGSVNVPVPVSVAVTGMKVASGSITVPVPVNASVSGMKSMAGSVNVPVVVAAAVSGQNAADAATSPVLCGPWATPDDIPAAVKAEIGITDQQWEAPLMRASEILWALSGRRWYGRGCTETAVLRSLPPRSGTQTWPYEKSWGACDCWSGATWINGYPIAPFLGAWLHKPGVFAVRLPRHHVTVDAVTVDGVPFTSYTYTRSGWLERLDGRTWDVCSGNTVVTYRHGEPPPAGGRDSAVLLAIELARDLYGTGKCRLPKRITSVTRQGVTMDFLDSMDVLERGGTGIASIDLWLRAFNPEAVPQQAWVWSPDIPSTSRRYP